MKTNVNAGDEVKWRTYSISCDTWQPESPVKAGEKTFTTLFQGVPNSGHRLQLISESHSPLPIEEIKVYRPYYRIK
ncbi:MAG TPA: hypothetical protein VFG54_09885 [Prolixibacteraceae bacterium]|nr:hypothetical protein [Prolixibacteraceae bacterium]